MGRKELTENKVKRLEKVNEQLNKIIDRLKKEKLSWDQVKAALNASYGMGDVEESEHLIKTQLGF